MTFLVRSLELVRGRRGAAITEFAIVLPVLIACVSYLVDVGVVARSQMRIKQATQAGVNYTIEKGFDVPKVMQVVRASSDEPNIQAAPAPRTFCGCASVTGVSEAVCTTPCPNGSIPGVYVLVTAYVDRTRLLPIPGLASSYRLTAESRGRIE